MRLRLKTNRAVLTVLILGFLVAGIAVTDALHDLIEVTQEDIATSLGSYYILVVAGLVVFAVWLGGEPFGRIRLGPFDCRPEYRYFTWFPRCCSPRAWGIGLVF